MFNTYDAWGNVLTWTGSLRAINPIRYRGYYYDTESGLYYLKSRYYDPQVGRFINADAQFDENAGFAGHNLFVYAANDPIQFIDDNGNAVLLYPGFIHQAVVYHIIDTHPGYNSEQIILYGNGLWGRADVVSLDGQVWEVKSAGINGFNNEKERTLEKRVDRARRQVNHYVNDGKRKDYDSLKLRKGDMILNGKITIYTRYMNYYVEYKSVEPGVVMYAYTSEAVPEQILSDIGKLVIFGVHEAVILFSGGLLQQSVLVQ